MQMSYADVLYMEAGHDTRADVIPINRDAQQIHTDRI